MVPSPPPLPPRPQVRQLTSNISSAVLKSARASLKAVQVPVVKLSVEVGKVVEGVPVSDGIDSDTHEHSYALAPSPAVHIEAETEDDVYDVKQVEEVQLNSSVAVKKARLSMAVEAPGSSQTPDNLATSPVLHHKLPGSGSRTEQDQGSTAADHTNMFGSKFIMWFDISIEGRSTDEEDWGGRINFGFLDNKFLKDLEDYFLMMEDECSSQTCGSCCVGRVMEVLCGMRDSALKPPSYDPRDVVDMLDKYRDGHILDMGWREVDTEEWFFSDS